jgi:hypothetical protein
MTTKRSFVISKDTAPARDLPTTESHGGLFIVSGAQGNLGQAYLRTLSQRFPQARMIGLHRRPLSGDEVLGVTYKQTDLSQRGNVEKALEGTTIDPGQRITLMFRYEPEGTPSSEHDRDGDGIDDDIYHSNVTTTRNVVAALLGNQPTAEVGITAFSSIIKEHAFPHFGSYDRAKAQMEEDLRRVAEGFPNVSAVVLNVPTLDTPAEHDIRPYAQQSETWLPPQQLVDHSLPEILSLGTEGNRGYQEVDIFTECPGFDLETFRDTHPQRWIEETGTDIGRGRYQQRR